MPPRDEQLSDHWQQELSHRRMFLFCNPDVTFSINLRRRGLLTTIYIYIYEWAHMATQMLCGSPFDLYFVRFYDFLYVTDCSLTQDK